MSNSRYHRIVEPEILHVTEADLVRNVHAILQRVETGAEVIIERNARPIAILQAPCTTRRTISECIAIAKLHEEQTGLAPALDPDFAADIEEVIRHREPWNPPQWD